MSKLLSRSKYCFTDVHARFFLANQLNRGPVQQGVFGRLERLGVGLEGVEGFEDALQQGVGLRDGGLEHFDRDFRFFNITLAATF
jgi:hypothetical protein